MPTDPASAPASGIALPAFEDGLGRRYRPATRNDGTPPEILCFRHELTDVPSFEFSLRERVARLTQFRHANYTRIRKVDRLNDARGTVALMSDAAQGTRLSEVLTRTDPASVLSFDARLALLRELAPAMTTLRKQMGLGHGAIAPERLIVTPKSHLMIVEHVTGAALEQLRYSPARYWKELRVALPRQVGLPCFDESADITQLGVLGLALVLGRNLGDDEYPEQCGDLVDSVAAHLRDWLRRALQLDVRRSFKTLSEAEQALEQLLSAEPTSVQSTDEVAPGGPVEVAAPTPAAAAPIVSEPTAAEPALTKSIAVEPVALAAPVAPPAPSSSTSSRTAASPTPSVAAPVVQSPAASNQPIAEVPETEDYDEEDEEESEEQTPTVDRRRWIAAALIGTVAAGGGLFAAFGGFRSSAPVVSTGTMAVDTNPTGGSVVVDGVSRGQAPLTLSLPAGPHTLVVDGPGGPRTVPVTITAGAQVSKYFELGPTAPTAGNLEIKTDPEGARIFVDGVLRGNAPLMIPDLAPGEHAVKLESEGGSVNQTVRIEAGGTNSLIVPLAAAPVAPASGWVSVSVPIAMQLYEQGRLLGDSGIDRIMLPSGRHDIDIVNPALAYREQRTVQIAPGKVSTINITLPKGTMSLNAIPYATVSIDGEAVGDTPIGNLSISIGPHDVVFTHPQLGEQRRVITVTQQTPVRFSIDLTKK
jgi:hypothetical protein